jgi:hypothetical protein
MISMKVAKASGTTEHIYFKQTTKTNTKMVAIPYYVTSL